MSKRYSEVEVQLGGEGCIKKLRYDFNAIADFEDLQGCSIAAIDENLTGIKFVRDALYCGLKWANRGSKFTPRVVGDMMQPDEFTGYVKAVMKGFRDALPQQEEAKEGGDESAANPPIQNQPGPGEDSKSMPSESD